MPAAHETFAHAPSRLPAPTTGRTPGGSPGQTPGRVAMPGPASGRITGQSARPALPRAPFALTVTMMSAVALLVVGQTFVTIPLMPELGVSWGVPTESAAWATSAFALAYAFGALVSGPLSDRYGRRTVMVTSVGAMSVATLLVPLAGHLVIGGVLRAVQGFLAGAFVPMSYAYLAERLPVRRLPLALTTVNCAAGATVVVAQVEGQLIGTALGWRWVFLVSAPLVALGALAAWKIMLPDTPRELRTGGPRDPADTRSLRSARLVPLFLVTLTCVGSLTALYTGVQLYGPAELVGDPDAMLALRASAVPAMITAVLISPVLGRIAAIPRAAVSFVVAAAGLLAAAVLAQSVLGLGAALFVFVLGISTVGPALVQALGSGAGTARATALAIYGFVLNLGSGAGAQLPLALDDLPTLALCVAAILLLCTGLVAVAGRAARRRPVRHAGRHRAPRRRYAAARAARRRRTNHHGGRHRAARGTRVTAAARPAHSDER